ncbi:GTP cyclohydrolase [Zooshikella harenae]|uniref:GTP cyclohydrolase n=1 Tax=Zooshikella harenae TaxID=2827238 RepID=A0ABS5ZEU8_9GAMM|nr:GTP cyclohydrolase [Zooshikella harenae]MBU2711780.1 GTP cyclohydrolase [Zooshikella harenae]
MKVIRKALGLDLVGTYQGLSLGGYDITNQDGQLTFHAVVYNPLIFETDTVPLFRINSACFSADIFGDNRCDCNFQLQQTMDLLLEKPGLMTYHFNHEGRGVGFVSKIEAYKLMKKKNIDTFHAHELLGLPEDDRNFYYAVLILHDLNIHRVNLITNNPQKCSYLKAHGIDVLEVIPMVSKRKEHQACLWSKVIRQGHLHYRQHHHS